MPEGDITPTFINFSDTAAAFVGAAFKKAAGRASMLLYSSL